MFPVAGRSITLLLHDGAAYRQVSALRICSERDKLMQTETEDYFHHKRPAEVENKSAEDAAKAAAQRRVDTFVEKRLTELGGSASASVA